MNHRTLLIAVCALFLAALTVSCIRSEIREGAASDLDRKLAPFSFIEDGDLLTFIVGTQPARFREEEAYLPIEISIANTGLRTLRITREAFTLVDADGNRYPAASPNELTENYQYLDVDRQRLATLPNIVLDKFAAYRAYPSKFSPTRIFEPGSSNSQLVRDRVNLPKFGFIIDMLYFPMPESGALGKKFDLFLDSPDLDDPVFVKFEIR